MQIKITNNARELMQTLAGIERRQLPFATVLALDAVAYQAQKAMQDRLPRIFALRGTEQLFRRAIKVRGATKRTLKAEVYIAGPLSGAVSTASRISRLIMRHEQGGVATTAQVYRTSGGLLPLGFYLPVAGLRTRERGIPRKYYPANIGVTSRLDASGASFYANSRKGKKIKRGLAKREFSYFATPRGIYERQNSVDGSELRLLWFFARRIRLQPRLGFFATVETTYRQRYAAEFQRAMAFAIKTAK